MNEAKKLRPPVEHWSRLLPQSRNHVHVKGQPLCEVLWQGEQFAVTSFGLEKRDGTYRIPSNVFWLKIYDGDPQKVMSGWFLHLSQKAWADEDDVDAAIQAMLVLFHADGTRTSVPAPYLMDENDIEEAANEAAERAYKETKDRLLHGLPL